jgi:hypothetical protein
VVYANDTAGNMGTSNTVQFTIHPADIDFNDRVYVSDNLLLAQAYGSRPGDVNWNPASSFRPILSYRASIYINLPRKSCGGQDSNPRTPTGADLESATFGLSVTPAFNNN